MKSLQRFITGLSRPHGGLVGEKHPPPPPAYTPPWPQPLHRAEPRGDLSAACPHNLPDCHVFGCRISLRLPSKCSPLIIVPKGCELTRWERGEGGGPAAPGFPLSIPGPEFGTEMLLGV